MTHISLAAGSTSFWSSLTNWAGLVAALAALTTVIIAFLAFRVAERTDESAKETVGKLETANKHAENSVTALSEANQHAGSTVTALGEANDLASRTLQAAVQAAKDAASEREAADAERKAAEADRRAADIDRRRARMQREFDMAQRARDRYRDRLEHMTALIADLDRVARREARAQTGNTWKDYRGRLKVVAAGLREQDFPSVVQLLNEQNVNSPSAVMNGTFTAAFEVQEAITATVAEDELQMVRLNAATEALGRKAAGDSEPIDTPPAAG